ncbi:hypothetical protein FRC07_005042 [Ceratobasidium sp. 392]|nr:hypothetical protein FRC07_005042 [Ceratobasidium sp. 392]
MRSYTSRNAQPCLPDQWDRFSVSVSRSANSKPPCPTSESWILLQKSTTSDVNDPSKCLIEEAGPCTTIHPEGSIIQHTDRVVSDRPVNEPLEAIGRSLLENAHLDGCGTAFVIPDGPRIRYYLVNHSAKTITWVSSDDIPSILRTTDPQRAQNMLCEQYWMHLENFPAPVPATAEDLKQLKVVLASLAIDASTSNGSTSPFSPAQIQDFLSMLSTFNPDKIEAFQTYTIARLWSMIWHARVVNDFGTAGVCLDRFTSLSTNPPAFTGPYKHWAKYLVSASEDAHLARCSRAWAGRIAYVTEWRSFKSKNEREWAQTMYLASVLVIASLLVSGQCTLSFAPSVALAFACASAAFSYHLITESQNLGEQAADASVYFQHWETAQYGIQALALRNATPRALLVWGFLVFLLTLV